MVDTGAVLERVRLQGLRSVVGRFFSQSVDQLDLIFTFLLEWDLLEWDLIEKGFNLKDLYVFVQLGCSPRVICSVATRVMERQMASRCDVMYQLFFTYKKPDDFALMVAFQHIPLWDAFRLWDASRDRLLSVVYNLGHGGDCKTFERVRLSAKEEDKLKERIVLHIFNDGKVDGVLWSNKNVIRTLYVPHLLPRLLKEGHVTGRDVFNAIRKKWVKYVDLDEYVFELDIVRRADVLEYRPRLIFTLEYFPLLKTFHTQKAFPREFFFPRRDSTKLLRQVLKYNGSDGMPIVQWIWEQVNEIDRQVNDISNSEFDKSRRKGIKRRRESDESYIC